MDPVAKYVSVTKSLLEIEKKAEEDENNGEKKSMVVDVIEISSGLGGRSNVRTKKPEHLIGVSRFGVGDTVVVRKEGETGPDAQVRGVVSGVTDREIQLSLDDFREDWWESRVVVARTPNEVTYTRMNEALSALESYSSTPAKHLIEIIFGVTKTDGPEDLESVTFLDKGLNEPQQEAVRLALSSSHIALIHGPPGTGKTTTVAEVIRQSVRRRERVLVCAHTNVAVDNLVEKLATGPGPKLRIVRLGHPARMLPSVEPYSLDALVSHADATSISKDVRGEVATLLKTMKRTRDKGERRRIRQEMRKLQREIRQWEDRAVGEIVSSAQVVLCTNTGAGDRSTLGDTPFDLVVIDEAAQALEASCWIPILRAPKLVLAGDPLQLSPTILSAEASKKGLGGTIFERVHKLYGEKISRMLTVQHRMHESIMIWSSDLFYGSRLTAHSSVAEHCLAQLPGVSKTEETESPLVFIDTSGHDFHEAEDPSGSKSNAQEAALVDSYVRRLIKFGVKPLDIGVITPYSAQVVMLKRLMRGSEDEPKETQDVEIGTVDGFQGREKEVIVLSMVRSSERREVGFLGDDRRNNVAVTRARRQICVIGDSGTLGTSKTLANLAEHLSDNGLCMDPTEFDE